MLDALVDDLAREPPGGLLVLVSDRNLERSHAATLSRRLRERGLRVEQLSVEGGEPGKSREAKAWLEDRLLELGADGDTALLALGGGVVSDLVGFTAATWHRGIPVVQVPTSLLAMVDAAVGGKTDVNVSGVKNLVGSVHQPVGVYADTAVLSTLPEREFVEGFAEVVKTAAIADASFFGWLETHASSLLERDAPALEHAIAQCVRIKARVVRRDERDSGRRAMLNFGHTVGHAVETVSGYRVGHGAAVSIGISVESRIACAATSLPDRHVRRLHDLLVAFGLPVDVPRDLPADDLVAAARQDKKNREGRIHCALPVRIGRMGPGAAVTVAVDEPTLVEAIERARAGGSD